MPRERRSIGHDKGGKADALPRQFGPQDRADEPVDHIMEARAAFSNFMRALGREAGRQDHMRALNPDPSTDD